MDAKAHAASPYIGSRRGIDINLMRHHPSCLNAFAAISAFSAPLGAMACPNRMPIADACDAPTNVPTGSNPHLLKLALFFHP